MGHCVVPTPILLPFLPFRDLLRLARRLRHGNHEPDLAAPTATRVRSRDEHRRDRPQILRRGRRQGGDEGDVEQRPCQTRPKGLRAEPALERAAPPAAQQGCAQGRYLCSRLAISFCLVALSASDMSVVPRVSPLGRRASYLYCCCILRLVDINHEKRWAL